MSFELSLPIILMAFVFELADSSLGMGYGTTLTPLLLILGYEPMEIVPAVLFSQSVCGVLAGLLHHKFGNVNFSPGTRDFKVAALMSSISLAGVLLAVGVALNVPAWVVKLYVGVLVLGIGLSVLRNHRRVTTFSWRRIAGLGFLAAFNKGISGGGYGPIVTGGQILAGVQGRNAVGIASLAEGITSTVGVIAYLSSTEPMNWHLAPSLLVGAVLSIPLSACIVSRIPSERLTFVIGSLSTALGSYTLARMLI